MVKLFQ